MKRRLFMWVMAASFAGFTACMPPPGGGMHTYGSSGFSGYRVSTERMISELRLNEKQSSRFKSVMSDMEKEARDYRAGSGSYSKASQATIAKKQEQYEAKFQKIMTNDQYQQFQQYGTYQQTWSKDNNSGSGTQNTNSSANRQNANGGNTNRNNRR